MSDDKALEHETTLIKVTDNSVRESDGVQPPQDNKPLEIGEDGLPIGIKIGGE